MRTLEVYLMQSSFKITSGIFQVLKPAIISTITGDCFIGNEPNGSQTENVVIGLLTNPINYVQSAILNVNTHVMGVDEHTADLGRLQAITDVLLPLLDDKYYLVDGTTLHLTIEDDKGVFKSIDNKGKFYYNIRVNCITL